MKRISLLVIVLLAAVMCALLLKKSFWDANRAALLVMLSVVAAGTLVRLARGLPFTTPDHYELSEIRALTKAIKEIMAKLRALIVVIGIAMALLVVVYPLAAWISRLTGWNPEGLEKIASALLGGLNVYVFARMYQVVCGDEDLTSVQSGFIERAVERRQAKKFDEARSSGAVSGESTFKKPDRQQ